MANNNQNRVPVEPDLKALLDLFKTDIFISLNCHAVATVQAFNPVTQTVQASINYKKTYYEGPALANEVLVDYPVLIDCPVVILTGGLASLTLPISKGDTCLILFNDRSIDDWYASGQVGPLSSQRMHSFSDGVALVGLRSFLNKLPTYDMTRAKLQNGPASVGVSSTHIRITNGALDLKDVINGSIDLLSNLETVLSTFASALVADAAAGAALAAALVPLQTAITAYKTAVVGGLLD